MIKRHIVSNMVGGFDAELGTSCPKKDPRLAGSLAHDRNSPDPKNRARKAKLVGRQEVIRPGSSQRNGFVTANELQRVCPSGSDDPIFVLQREGQLSVRSEPFSGEFFYFINVAVNRQRRMRETGSGLQLRFPITGNHSNGDAEGCLIVSETTGDHRVTLRSVVRPGSRIDLHLHGAVPDDDRFVGVEWNDRLWLAEG